MPGCCSGDYVTDDLQERHDDVMWSRIVFVRKVGEKGLHFLSRNVYCYL